MQNRLTSLHLSLCMDTMSMRSGLSLSEALHDEQIHEDVTVEKLSQLSSSMERRLSLHIWSSRKCIV